MKQKALLQVIFHNGRPDILTKRDHEYSMSEGIVNITIHADEKNEQKDYEFSVMEINKLIVTPEEWIRTKHG